MQQYQEQTLYFVVFVCNISIHVEANMSAQSRNLIQTSELLDDDFSPNHTKRIEQYIS
jgi:hypothetical protein